RVVVAIALAVERDEAPERPALDRAQLVALELVDRLAQEVLRLVVASLRGANGCEGRLGRREGDAVLGADGLPRLEREPLGLFEADDAAALLCELGDALDERLGLVQLETEDVRLREPDRDRDLLVLALSCARRLERVLRPALERCAVVEPGGDDGGGAECLEAD